MDYRDTWAQADLSRHHRTELPRVAVKPGLVLEDLATGYVGAVIQLGSVNGQRVVGLEDRHGRVKRFPLGPGFLLDGRPINLVEPPRPTRTPTRQVSRSGSIAVADAPARTARASRIWVEGIHDAELIEKVWGHDLRVEGIVVEPLHGIDDLATAVASFNPAPHRKLGILVDHLTPGSKEERLAQQAMTVPGAAQNVLIVGHPFVDIWQAVKPQVLGLDAWPTVPRGEDWKTGILRRFGRPADSPEDVRAGWDSILTRVNTYTDLEPTLLGPVEHLIDFVTLDPGTPAH
ncbi:DUF3097 family protein [Rothia nasimurium]|uniref:DUF3097 family protein n=5 Tax=Rothia nasimurium TaxID=85336 RepID=UPI001F2003D8|nr:DUF3097 family protein [Rothia nasimurium]